MAARLIALLATGWPATPAEHVGSSAVPGLAGKNIIDLLMVAALAALPFQAGSASPATYMRTRQLSARVRARRALVGGRWSVVGGRSGLVTDAWWRPRR